LLETAGDHGHGGHGHGQLAHAPVAGGSQEHVADDDHGHGSIWPDVTRKELLTLVPLAVLTIFFGIYPKPIFDILQPSLERILLPFMS